MAHAKISKYRYHWIMCSHMRGRAHSARSPDSEAVRWIAENAQCSLKDALAILKSAIVNKVVVFNGKTYDGSWHAALTHSRHIWEKHLSTNADSTEESPHPPDGRHKFRVESAEEVGGVLRLSLDVRHEGRHFTIPADVIDETDAEAFLRSVGRFVAGEGITLTDLEVLNWEGEGEVSDSGTTDMLFRFVT